MLAPSGLDKNATHEEKRKVRITIRFFTPRKYQGKKKERKKQITEYRGMISVVLENIESKAIAISQNYKTFFHLP